MPRLLGVGRLDADDQDGLGQYAETERDHERPGGCREVHVGQLVAAAVDAQRGDVEHLRSLHDDAAWRPAQVDCVDHEEDVDAAHQLLHEVDTADADLEHPHAGRQRLDKQCLRDGGTDPVIGPEHVAEAGDDRVHRGPRTSFGAGSLHDGRLSAVAESEQEMLAARLRRYAPDRYPVQHATTQFHLGSMLLQSGDTAAGVDALRTARDLFAHVGMKLEQAKATLMMGVALRTAGQFEEASDAFRAALALLGELEQPAEQGAAAYNLGLVRQDLGDASGAHAAWSEARRLFLSGGYPAQASGAARDHGASLLNRGDATEALPLLEEALELAARAGDEQLVGSAANVLGLAQVAAGDPVAAASSLQRAAAAFPRSLRPAEHAMAKANIALAHEQAGDADRARLAARQALAVAGAAAPVRTQARRILARLGNDASDDLLSVLDTEERVRWVPVIRDEVLRAVDLSREQRNDIIRRFLDGVLARPASSYELSQDLLHVVLELPPQPYALLVASIVEGCAARPEEDTDRLHEVISSAMARFAMPQWQRLAASLNAAEEAAGRAATWR